MSKYSKGCDSAFWTRHQRSSSLKIEKQDEKLRRTLDCGLSATLQLKNEQKRERSADIYSENRISTCAFVQRTGNGNYQAIPFYSRPFTAANMASTEETLMNKSAYKTSTSTDFYRPHSASHCGMGSTKPLMKYNPNAARSRLPVDDFKQYYVNRSVVEIGDRRSVERKHYVTTNNNMMGRNPHKNYISKHPGIVSYQVQWDHTLKTK